MITHPTCALRHLPADMHRNHRPGQDLQDDGIFDCLDDLVDVPFSDCVCDLPSVGPPSSDTPLACSSNVQWSCMPAQDFRNITEGSQDTEPDRSSESKRTEHARALGRRSQRRFREKRKDQWDQLQAELAEAKAALKRLQSEKSAAYGVSAVAKSRTQAYTTATSIHQTYHIAMQAPVVLDHDVLSQLMQTPWTTKAILTCELSKPQEEACQQLAGLSSASTAVMSQGYITEMAHCLMSTGQDMDSAAGRRLQQLFNEFWCLYSVKARVAPRQWRKLVDSPFLADSPDATMALPSPDWATLKHVMQIQPPALDTFLKLRREYITNTAWVSKRRQQLLQQLQSAPQLLGIDSREIGSRLSAIDEITEQLQQCVIQEDELLFQFSGTVCLTVGTLWQSCIATVHTFPLFPDALAFANFLAEQAGQPSVQQLHADVMAGAVVEEQGITQCGRLGQQTASSHQQLPQQAGQQLGVVIDSHEVQPQDIFGQA